MVQAADGGGGGTAGPQEQKLFHAYQARLETLETAAQSWSQGATLLAAVSQALGAQAGQLVTSFGPNNPTGRAAAERYREVQSKVERRAEEMTTASGALKHSHAGLVAGSGRLRRAAAGHHQPARAPDRPGAPDGPGRRPQAGDVRRGARRA